MSAWNSSNPNTGRRSELLGKNNYEDNQTTGRAWGEKARESRQTENLENHQILTLQKNMMEEQDQTLDLLAASVGRQKEIALEIGKEADEQNRLLDELDEKVDNTGTKIRNATRKVMRVAKAESTKAMWACICILVLGLVVVSFLAVYL